MTPFYSTNLLKLAFTVCAIFLSFIGANAKSPSMETLNIVTTDSSALYLLQESSQELALSQRLNVNISLVDESKLMRSLQLGKKGEVLITSDINLCQNLVSKGLASPLELQKISQESVYCTGLSDDGKVLMLMPERTPSATQEKITNIAIALNASVYVFAKNEDAHRKMEEWLKFRVPVCGFGSTFLSLNVKHSTLQKTNAMVEYFACPLIGIKKDGYSILIKHYETQHNS
jgi:hypothetical protein